MFVDILEALTKRIETVEKRNLELEQLNRHLEYFQQASVYPYGGYSSSGFRTNPPYFPTTPPYLMTSPLHEISTSNNSIQQSHLAPHFMTITPPEVSPSSNYSHSETESTTDFHCKEIESLDNSVLSETSVDCYIDEASTLY